MEESGDELGECPICIGMFPRTILDNHANSCLDSSQSGLVASATTGSPSLPKFDIVKIKEEPPEIQRKRQRGDLGGWVVAESPKKPFLSEAKVRANVKTEKGKSPSGITKSFFSPLRRNVTLNGGTKYGTVSGEAASRYEGLDKATISNKERVFRQLSSNGVPNENSSSDQAHCEAPSTSIGREGLNKAKLVSNDSIPLADRMRPKCLKEFIGQEKILSEASMLHTLVSNNTIPSMILWGPPGCGKTSLANIISVQCKETNGQKFVKLSATSSGVNDVKEAIKIAKNEFALLKRKTILFIDEIHRFNKLQQDTFLPYVEDGTITLIGATTENPSFSLNSALLSRCRVFVLEKLSADNIKDILQTTLKQLDIVPVDDISKIGDERFFNDCIEKDAISLLAHMSDGDARTALNCLHLAVQSQKSKLGSEADNCRTNKIAVSAEQIKESLQRTHLLYDKKGDEHFNCISALHKSMRGHNADASLFWLGRMLEGGEDPLYVARRLVRFSSEDVGLADPGALNQAVAAYQACHFIGMPECEVILAQCVVYLAEAPKSVRVYNAYNKVKSCIQNYAGPLPGVPLHLRNAPTKLMKDLGYSKGYKYNPNFKEPVEQDYLPDELKHMKFLDSA